MRGKQLIGSMVMDERCKHDLLPGQCGFCLSPQTWRETSAVRRLSPGWRGSPHPRSQGCRRSVMTMRALSPGRAQVPRPIRPFPGDGCRPSPACRFQGPELLAPGWGLSGSEEVEPSGLGGSPLGPASKPEPPFAIRNPLVCSPLETPRAAFLSKPLTRSPYSSA